jgi:hypothetical protein
VATSDPALESLYRLPAADAIEAARFAVAGLPVYIAGSAAAAAQYPQIDDTSYDDVDLFCGTREVLIASAQRLMHAGFQPDDRMERVWHRWLRYGFKGWHTNSLKLELPLNTPQGRAFVKVNLVYKMVDGHPTTSLGQVLESFDFGLLAVGFDCEQDTWRDMRDYFFPGVPPTGPLPLLPNRRDSWRNGFVSQYQGLREVGRFVKYRDYGYDMSLVQDDLHTGYWKAAEYLVDRTDNP